MGRILSGIILFLSTFIFDAAAYDGQVNEKEIYCLINRGANHCMFDGIWKDVGEIVAELPETLEDGEHGKSRICMTTSGRMLRRRTMTNAQESYGETFASDWRTLIVFIPIL